MVVTSTAKKCVMDVATLQGWNMTTEPLYVLKCRKNLWHDKFTVVKQASAKLLLVPMPMAKGAWQSIRFVSIFSKTTSCNLWRISVPLFHGPITLWLLILYDVHDAILGQWQAKHAAQQGQSKTCLSVIGTSSHSWRHGSHWGSLPHAKQHWGALQCKELCWLALIWWLLRLLQRNVWWTLLLCKDETWPQNLCMFWNVERTSGMTSSLLSNKPLQSCFWFPCQWPRAPGSPLGLCQSSRRLLVATFDGFLFPYFTDQSPFDCWFFMMFMMLSWGNGRLNTQHNRVNLRLASV